MPAETAWGPPSIRTMAYSICSGSSVATGPTSQEKTAA